LLLAIDCASHGDNNILCAAGENAVYYCRTSGEMVVEQKWISPLGDQCQWTFVQCAWRGADNAILIAASAESSRLWMPDKNVLKRDAHHAAITGLQIRPWSSNSYAGPQFATSSMDGTIKIWQHTQNSTSIDTIAKVTMGNANPVMALSYSPDAFCLAGASYGIARVWNAEHDYHHMGEWSGTGTDWQGDKLRDDDMMSIGGMSTSANGDTASSSTDHSLVWDVDSKKLAFSLGAQVSQEPQAKSLLLTCRRLRSLTSNAEPCGMFSVTHLHINRLPSMYRRLY